MKEKKAAQFLSSEFEGPEDSPGFLLWRLCNSWQRAQRAALAPLKLTHVQFVLMAGIAWLEERVDSLTQAELARHSGTDPMMTSQVLRVLEERGFVRRSRSDHNRRIVELSLTSQGRVAVEQALAVVEATDKRVFAAVGADVKELTRLLAVLVVGEES